MKHNTKILVANSVMLILGIALLVLGFTETTASSIIALLVSLGGALSLSSAFWIIRCVYWGVPSRKTEYESHIKAQSIDLKDERKIMLRDKSGRTAYLIGLAVLVVCILVFRVLQALNIYDVGRAFFIFTGVFVLFEYLLGIIIFNIMSKKL